MNLVVQFFWNRVYVDQVLGFFSFHYKILQLEITIMLTILATEVIYLIVQHMHLNVANCKKIIVLLYSDLYEGGHADGALNVQNRNKKP